MKWLSSGGCFTGIGLFEQFQLMVEYSLVLCAHFLHTILPLWWSGNELQYLDSGILIVMQSLFLKTDGHLLCLGGAPVEIMVKKWRLITIAVKAQNAWTTSLGCQKILTCIGKETTHPCFFFLTIYLHWSSLGDHGGELHTTGLPVLYTAWWKRAPH